MTNSMSPHTATLSEHGQKAEPSTLAYRKSSASDSEDGDDRKHWLMSGQYLKAWETVPFWKQCLSTNISIYGGKACTGNPCQFSIVQEKEEPRWGLELSGRSQEGCLVPGTHRGAEETKRGEGSGECHCGPPEWFIFRASFNF